MAKKTFAVVLPLLGVVFLGVVYSFTSAADTSLNSQTVPVLASAINIDPSPSIGGGDIALADGVALVAQEGPSGTAADIESRPANSQISVYVVRPGDSLSDIASMFDVPVNTILGANDISHGVIKPGQELVILPIAGIQHTVARGETLASLAATYNSNAHDIAQYNNLTDDDSLTVGTQVIIPNGETTAPAAKVTPKKSTGSGSTIAKAKPKTSTKTGSKKKLSMLELARLGRQTAPLYGAGGPEYDNYYQWPVAGGVITQGLHGFDAVDIGARTGTDIYASAAGTVIIARGGGGWNGGYGNYIVIQHANGTQTLYGHASKLLVSAGDTVAQGDVIAEVGATGEATGPHLHFEVRGAHNPFGDLSVGESGD